MSNGLDLSRINWGTYDLVVIDESHNFRNGGKIIENPDENDKENRYVTLMKKVIRAGVKTKVLMLSATPVNNRFKIIAIVRRKDGIEEKWVVVPDGVTFSKEEIRRQIHFQEQYFDSEIVM